MVVSLMGGVGANVGMGAKSNVGAAGRRWHAAALASAMEIVAI
jgi:hypothetical protein